MRLVMLAPFGLRPKGTLGARMLPLAQMLTRRGYEVHIVAPSDLNPADAGRSEILDGVLVEHLPLPYRSGLQGMLETSLRMLRCALALDPQIIHLFKPKGYGGIAALLLRLLHPSLPLVVDTDDWEGRGGWNERLPYPPAIKRLIDWQERTLPRLADAVTVASRTLETQVWGNGVQPRRVFYLPNGIRPGQRHFPEREEARRMLGLDERLTGLLYTRFWEFQVEDIAAALVGIATQRPDFRLLVIGRGEQSEERRLQMLAERAGVAAALNQRGWADEATITAALAAADVCLYPMDDTLINRAKAPAKLLELMEAGRPIVAAGVGEVREYLADGQAGRIVPPGNAGALARGVLTLLSHPDLAHTLGARARERVTTVFNWQRLAALAELAYATARSGR